jgi:hypothetical protein
MRGMEDPNQRSKPAMPQKTAASRPNLRLSWEHLPGRLKPPRIYFPA